jgi:hypothetical protein
MLRRHATAEGGIRGGVEHHLGWVAARPPLRRSPTACTPC